jgi:hypothetical protein
MINKKYYIYSVLLFSIFIVVVSFFGVFNIGILSDTFGDAYTAVNSSFTDKVTNNLQFIDVYRYRPVLFLTLQEIVNANNLLGLSYDNFILYKIISIFLYLLFALISGKIILHITKEIKLSLLTEVIILINPNNLHNLCWSAAYFEILCGIFFLSALYYVFKYLENSKLIFLIVSNIFFVVALLTKEITITLPFLGILIVLLIYGNDIFFKNKKIFISQLVVLFIYFISKTFLSTGIPFISSKYFYGDFLVNSLQIILKGIVALLIPLDFSLIKVELSEHNLFLIAYILLVISFFVIYFIKIVKQKLYKEIISLILIFLFSISPYIYAGYIRPQLILLPFTVILISLISTVRSKKDSLKNVLIAVIIFWLYYGFGVINDWKYAYAEGKSRMENLLKVDFSKEKKTILIGNPARYRQCFMFDNIMFPYNYYKYHKFVLSDTISDIIRTVSIDRNSLNSKIVVKEFGNNEYELLCTGKTQFFYLDGDDSKIKKDNGIKNEYMSVEFLEFNDFGKPVKLKLKFIMENLDAYIFEGDEINKLK